MDQLKGAFNSFTGGSNQNQQHNQQPQGQGYQQPQGQGYNQSQGQGYQQSQGEGYQQRPSGAGGFDLQGAFNSFTGGNNQNQQHSQQQYGQQQYGQQPQGEGSHQQASGGGSFFSGLTDKFNTAAGGGRESEKNEDYLDKGVDFVQEKFLGQGPQDNESALEQAKDEQISDFIRDKYKSTTGKEFFVKDKETKF